MGLAYEYGVEPALAWYSGDIYDKQFEAFKVTGWIGPVFWSLFFSVLFLPFTLVIRRLRHNLKYLFGISIIINMGMWTERYMLTAATLTHGFLPHAWTVYIPSWIEFSITLGTFAFFILAILILIRLVPAVPIADLQEELYSQGKKDKQIPDITFSGAIQRADGASRGVVGTFRSVPQLLNAFKIVLDHSFRKLEIYSPFAVEEVNEVFGSNRSPVRIWTLAGACFGIGFAFFITNITASWNDLIVGAKHPHANIPYWVLAFEFGVLFAAFANFYGFLFHARLIRKASFPGYDNRFSSDRFGFFIACNPQQNKEVTDLLVQSGGEEIHEVRPYE